MNIGKVIESRIKKNKVSKQKLYSLIKENFYKNKEDEFIAYNTFTLRIAENKLSAQDFVQIGYVLNLNLNEFKGHISRNLKINKKMEDNVMNENLELMKKNSIYFKEGLETLVRQVEEDTYYFMVINKHIDMVSIEEFDFNNNSFINLSEVCFSSEETQMELKEFMNLSEDEKFNLVKEIGDEYLEMFPNEKPALREIEKLESKIKKI